MMTMQPLTDGGQEPAPVFIHVPCLEVTTWTAAEGAEYGPIRDQGCDRCDCAADGMWRRIHVELEETR